MVADHAGSKSGPEPLAGKRILIIEDEFLIALDIESTLRNAGAVSVEMASDVEGALRGIASNVWDAAVADNNLQGCSCQEVVAALIAHHIPFLILTGYDPRSLPRNIQGAPILAKPFARDTLVASVRDLCRPHGDAT